MPTWGELLRELNDLEQKAASPGGGQPNDGQSPCDRLRRKYLKLLSEHTKRATICYSTSWMENKPVPNGSETLTVALRDIHGFMEAASNIEVRELDLIITSPGGDADAAEAIMGYLRSRFDHIRAVVPVAAMSAATMMALSCDEILMGTHSQLGPIDPQFTVTAPEGQRSSPAQAIIDQFELAKAECQDPANLGAWLPILRTLAPGLVAQCTHAIERAKQFVTDQLTAHMLSGDDDAAARVAEWFADFPRFKSHGRPVRIDDVESQNLRVIRLEDDDKLQDLVLSVHHATRLTFGRTAATKLIENHRGRAFIESMHVQPTGPIEIAIPTAPGIPQPQSNGS
ncbi:SDH family Clp fold serine proteinase [Candidatus Poriferisodalis sp.]|uniref:SDH family Clp fold serine proteinase n=1 Tax=Candidatus Poriferisodalis sp. TaxID=3101277 RepID=UPI003B5B9C68